MLRIIRMIGNGSKMKAELFSFLYTKTGSAMEVDIYKGGNGYESDYGRQSVF